MDDFQAIWKGGPLPEEDDDDEEYRVLRAAIVQHERDNAVESDTEDVYFYIRPRLVFYSR